MFPSTGEFSRFPPPSGPRGAARGWAHPDPLAQPFWLAPEFESWRKSSDFGWGSKSWKIQMAYRLDPFSCRPNYHVYSFLLLGTDQFQEAWVETISDLDMAVGTNILSYRSVASIPSDGSQCFTFSANHQNQWVGSLAVSKSVVQKQTTGLNLQKMEFWPTNMEFNQKTIWLILHYCFKSSSWSSQPSKIFPTFQELPPCCPSQACTCKW